MKKYGLLMAAVLTMIVSPGVAATYYWTNAAANNNFSVLGNWNTLQNGSGTVADNLADDVLLVNLSGTNKAQLSAILADQPTSVRVGTVANATGELVISDGALTILDTLRVGINATATGIVTISGGTINALNSYATFGDTGAAIVTMSGGVLNTDRTTWGQNTGVSCTLNMTGGTMNFALSDLTPAVSSGGLRMGLGNTTLNFSGTAVVNTQKLWINEGGLMILNDNATINVTGTVDANPTFNFTEEAIAGMLGKIQFDGGNLIVTGNVESLFDAAIGNGNIYTTATGMSVDAQFADGFTTLQLVPEPMTLAILGLGSLFLRRRR